MSETIRFPGNANDLVRNIESDLDISRESLEEAENELRRMLDSAQAEGRDSLSPIEDRRAEFLYGDIRRMRAAVKRQESRLNAALAVADDENRLEQRHQTITPTNAGRRDRPAYDRVMRVSREARTYNPESDRAGKLFLQDVVRHFARGDVLSADRLARHMQEEIVERGQYLTRAAGDETTSNFSGLTVPQYLVDMVAPATAAMRPFADACTNKHNLPSDGMSVNISRITTPTSAGLQAM